MGKMNPYAIVGMIARVALMPILLLAILKGCEI
jgi:hypothetical protein